MVRNDKPAFDFTNLDRPWVCFFLFSLSNALLAYASWSLTTKLLIAFYGLLLPAALFLWGRRTLAVQNVHNSEFPRTESGLLSPPARVLWWIFGVLFLFTRFYRIDSNPVWPIKDVGHFGILGLSLLKNGTGGFYGGNSRLNPFIFGAWVCF